jgi:uracil-DNA glycosylase family 4
MDQERLVRLARQHAETSRLLGVDFVPSYRTGGDDDAEAVPDAPHEPTPVRMIEPPAVQAVASATIEPKPIAPIAGRSAKQAALDALRARYEKDAPHKNFVTAFTNIVWGDGDPDAKLMFIGEAPGEDEDREGKPFVGRSGQLLNKMIEAMGLSRETVYICNVLKTRPLNNATPTPTEIDACAPYLHEQVAIVRPGAIVTLGLPAAKAVLRCPPTATMGALRSKWTTMNLPGNVQIPVMPTYHPAFLLRSYTPENRAKVWSDLQMVMELLGMKPREASPKTG